MYRKTTPAAIRPLVIKAMIILLLAILIGVGTGPLTLGSANLSDVHPGTTFTSAIRHSVRTDGLQTDDRVLEPGKPLERQLGRGSHNYQVTLEAGQFLHVVVEQRGIDVIVTLFAPDGKQLVEMDSPNGDKGPEPVFTVAETTGHYRLEVRSLDKSASVGSYEIRIEALRTATEQDKNRIAAQKAFFDGEMLLRKQTKESLNEALVKYQVALTLWQAANDQNGEAEALSKLAQIYSNLGQAKKAIEYNIKELPLRRSLGNPTGEAITLNNIGVRYYQLSDYRQAGEYFEKALLIHRETKNSRGESTALTNLGAIYSALGEKRKALEYYNASLVLKRNLNNQTGVASTLNLMGSLYVESGDYEKAQDYYNQALLIRKNTGDRRGEASTLANLSGLYGRMGNREKALDSYLEALPLMQSVGDRNGESSILLSIGKLYDELGEPQKAIDYLNRGLSLSREINDRRNEADALDGLGGAYTTLGDFEKAISYLNQALTLFRQLGLRGDEADTLNDIGVAYNYFGVNQKALDFFDQAVQLRRAIGNRRGEAQSLHNIGSHYLQIGEKPQALGFFNRALPIWEELKNRDGKSNTLNSIGLVYSESGDYQKSFDYFNQALLLTRAIGDRRGEAGILNNISGVYNYLGDHQKALDYYKQALDIWVETRDQEGETTALSNIGGIYAFWLSDRQQGLDYYHRSLELARARQDRRSECSSIAHIGRILTLMGEPEKARTYLDKALELSRELGDLKSEGNVFSSLAMIAEADGEIDKARSWYEQSLTLDRSTGNRYGEAENLFALARLKEREGRLPEALMQIEQAINITESLRANVAIQDLRAAFLGARQRYYHLRIDLLMRLHLQHSSEGYDAAALQTSERARARSLLELLAESQSDIREGLDKDLLVREREIQERINTKAEILRRLKSSLRAEPRTALIEKDLDALTTELQQVEGVIRQKSPRYAALTQPQPLTLAETQQQVLDSDTMLLEYSLGEERSFLWVVMPSTLKSYELPRRSEIDGAAKRVYELLIARSHFVKGETRRQYLSRVAKADKDYWMAASSLSRMLLGPVADELKAKRLVIVSDGILHYIPFSALPNPAAGNKPLNQKRGIAERFRPLVLDYEIVHLPSASTLAALRRELSNREPAPKIAAVLADPVFESNDVRVRRKETTKVNSAGENNQVADRADFDLSIMTRALSDTEVASPGQPIQRLSWSAQEAAVIKDLTPESLRKVILGFGVNHETVTDPELGQYKIVHFATHGLLDSKRPELTGILLSLVNEQGEPQQNGVLRLGEIYNLRLPAELVVLSACQTALGQEIKGEGIVGLTRGFMYAGAARVLASLWNVNDKATADLMRRFYTGMLKGMRLRPAAALRQAQIEMWHNPGHAHLTTGEHSYFRENGNK